MRINPVNDRLARMVVRILRKRPIPGVQTAYLCGFSNCREQGFVLHIMLSNGKHIAFSFAENRNSDHVVVYPGDWNVDFPAENGAGVEECRAKRSLHRTPQDAADEIERQVRSWALHGETRYIHPE